MRTAAQKWLFLVWALVAVVWAGWLGLKYLEWNFTHFVVTDDRVIYRTGVLAKRGVEIPMERINNINFHQGHLGAGHRRRRPRHRVGGQGRPVALRRRVAPRRRAAGAVPPDGGEREEARGLVELPGVAAAAPAAPPSVPEQLQQLADLRDRGVITAAEFETKKAQLLERSGACERGREVESRLARPERDRDADRARRRSRRLHALLRLPGVCRSSAAPRTSTSTRSSRSRPTSSS